MNHIDKVVLLPEGEEEEEIDMEGEPLFWTDHVKPSVPLALCRFYYVFVGLDRQIQKVQQESVEVPADGELTFSLLHQRIRQRTGSHYKLVDTLVFHLDVDHDEIFPFLDSSSLDDVIQTHLRVIPFLNDVVFHPSPVPLHDANRLYFILSEKEATVPKPKLQWGDGKEEGGEEFLDVAYNRTKRHYGRSAVHRKTRKQTKAIES